MRVVLVVALKLGRVLAEDVLEHCRRHAAKILVPHLVEGFSECRHKSAFGPQRVLMLELLNKQVLLVQKELG